MKRVWDKGPMNAFIDKITNLLQPVAIISESTMVNLPLMGS